MSTFNAVIIGMGNRYRSDDGAGLQVAQNIKRVGPKNIRVLDGVCDGTALIEAWKNAHVAIVIDTVVSGASAGYIYRFDAIREPIPEDYFIGYSTHAFSITQTVQLAKMLGILPRQLIVYGIEGENFSAGTELSPKIHDAVLNLTENILTEIRRYERQTGGVHRA